MTAENYIGVDNLLPNKQGKVASNYLPLKGSLIEYKAGDILIGNIRPYLKKIWLATNNGGTNGDVLTIRIREQYQNEITSQYLYYILSSDAFFDYAMQYAKGAKMPRGDKEIIMKYRILLPSLDEQNRIVAILDRFTVLTSDIAQGLPAEIAARQKQYEHYRDKLLTFKELKESV